MLKFLALFLLHARQDALLNTKFMAVKRLTIWAVLVLKTSGMAVTWVGNYFSNIEDPPHRRIDSVGRCPFQQEFMPLALSPPPGFNPRRRKFLSGLQ